jgi:hypothetical protein
MQQCPMIYRLNKTRSEHPMYFHRSSDNLARQLHRFPQGNRRSTGESTTYSFFSRELRQLRKLIRGICVIGG